ncbi:MAG TPA: UDP-N-acetylmuramoylalanyl-D-glutamyl-2,6-diaminopimelate--D-alanyl-D-alanine ligase [Micropepsaceae bacterium]|nr:UDP-N-acetylmuramoylalanyl-D-glutamyl-2,6-diaminopimelate--D-alanyl-D-alanine ligase [Micropepsaceae bacterium]
MSGKSLWTSDEAVRVTGGRTTAAWSATGVSIDTRTIMAGDLFVALQGDARDGHEFVRAALEKNAAAALVSRIPADVPDPASLLVVDDTLRALESLGRASRQRSNARIIAVTGSAGKTTTKEMLRAMLSREGAVAASAASYNNHWGVPLSLARMPRDTVFGIFEIGMNHAGEIRNLVRHVRPHVAVITTVAAAHLEFFGTVEAIADAKAEILEGIESGGACVLPADNAQFERLRRRAEELKVKTIASFGSAANADANLISITPAKGGQQVASRIFGRDIEFRIGAPGRHLAMNALAAIASIGLAGGDMARAAAELESFGALMGRGARATAGDIEIIDESYNANPASMAAALDVLASAPVGRDGRRIAVLGDMLELGTGSDRLHAGLANDIAAAKTDLVFLCGPHMRALWSEIPQARRGAWRETSAELTPDVIGGVREGDVVLVKGSLGSRMSVIVEALKKREPATA